MRLYQTAVFLFTLVERAVADLRSSTFQLMTSPEGLELCASDVPIEVLWIPYQGSDIPCGLQCIERLLCKAFNSHSLTGRCELFETVPSNLTVTAGCNSYRAIRAVHVTLFRIISLLNSFAVTITEPEAVLAMMHVVHPPARNQLWYIDDAGLLRAAMNKNAPTASANSVFTAQPFYTTNDNQQWMFKDNHIKNVKMPSYSFDILNGWGDEGQPIIFFDYTGGLNQLWRMDVVSITSA